MKRMRAFTLIELLVVMAIIALLIGLLLPALARARATARQVKDGTQIAQIHKSWLIYSGENKGIFPTPGLINRLAVPGLGQTPGRGDEDILQNDTKNLYSVCIAQNFFTPELAVSTSEPNGNVLVKIDYNYSVIRPMADKYWDDTFKADLGALSNVSYSSTPMFDQRKTREWKNSLTSKFAIVGNRGVQDGDVTTNSTLYENSKTLEIHGSRKEWIGNICFNDNHIDVLGTFYPEGVTYQQAGETKLDNIFKNDTGSSGTDAKGYDCWNVIIKEIQGAQASPVLVPSWD